MALPIVAPAPVVTEHVGVFRDVCDTQGQFRHFQHDLTGLIVLPNKRMAHIARCLLESADKTPLSRVLSEARWREGAVKRRRSRFMLQETTPHRDRRRESLGVIAETLGEQVGSLFDDVDRHSNHRDGPCPRAHHPVTRVSVRGPVRFPWGLRLSRRDEELPQWDACGAHHVPDLTSPTTTKARNRLQKQVDPVWLYDPAFRARHEPFQTNIALAIARSAAALRHTVPVRVVVFDTWSLAEAWVHVLARRRKAWVSRLKKNRGRQTASVHLRDAHGWPLKWPSPHIAVEALVSLIPANA